MKWSIRLTVLLVLMAATAMPAAAHPHSGSNPYAAQPLNNGLNVGRLAPGEEFWYVFSNADLGDQPARTVVLNLVYKPGSHDVAAYVNFHVLTLEQVDRWLQGYTDQYMGLGTFSTTDFDQETAERLWSGDLSDGVTYQVHLFNNSGQTVEYHLTALGQPAAYPTQPTSLPGPSSDVTPSGAGARNLQPGSAPEETQWLLVAATVQSMSTADAAAWLMLASQAGWLPPADRGVSTGGPSLAASAYGPVERAALIETTNTPYAEHGAALSPQPSALFDLYPSIYPSAALALQDGVNIGKLAPGGEHWYSFIREDRDAEWFEFMPITLFSTPTDGNSSHDINFQMFTGAQLHIWQRGTPEDMVPMGAGQWVSRDKDPVTGERIWAGHVVDGDLYYVRVFNHSDHVIDYYLITGDIVNTELGDRVWAANPVSRHTLWQTGSYIPFPH